MIWVRGQIVADEALTISVLDRTFEHGLGLFETFRTWNGHPTLLPRHLDRLSRSAGELGLPLDRADLPDAAAVADLLRAEGRSGDAMLRITLSGGISAIAGLDTLDESLPLAPAGSSGRCGDRLALAGAIGPAGGSQDLELLVQPADVRERPERGFRRVRDDLTGRPALGRQPHEPLRGGGRASS